MEYLQTHHWISEHTYSVKYHQEEAHQREMKYLLKAIDDTEKLINKI